MAIRFGTRVGRRSWVSVGPVGLLLIGPLVLCLALVVLAFRLVVAVAGVLLAAVGSAAVAVGIGAGRRRSRQEPVMVTPGPLRWTEDGRPSWGPPRPLSR